MTSQKIISSVKNAMGTVFLLAGAFFVCSTLVSIRAVFADPIAPTNANEIVVPQGTRTNVRTSGRTSPRGTNSVANRATVARTAVAPTNNPRANTSANQNRAVQSRAVATRTNARTTNKIANQRADMTKSRNVVNRTKSAINRANANLTRNVRARTASSDMVDNARVSLQGSAIRGSKGTQTTAYSYLNSKLYTGNYSNIIDSSTGLISADAFSNCMESYYTCMDEICTARNAAQRRCACAGRVKAFADAESQLETANEELIKASGELALLIANKGKDISQAFQLTDAEKVMNCVSWKEVTSKYGQNSEEAIAWCSNHNFYNNGAAVTSCTMPSYCQDNTAGGNNFGFNIDNIEGSSSDILASLQAWADAKDSTKTLLKDDTTSLTGALDNVSTIVGNLSGIGGAFTSTETSADKLANTWGYDLFEFAHNNVCSRVLDSCFNGIYEACGNPTAAGGIGKCADGQSSTNCPFNYNSKIAVGSDGDIELFERKASSTNNSAVCFGYNSTNGDPYSNLRGPVADARRSIMNKYLLDANADCDVYGEQLRVMAQNIGYQKVAAQQALQQKRLEFATEEKESVLNSVQTAYANFNECLSEIWECYEETSDSEPNWTTSRIKTYCAQIANVPHCYEEMICQPSGAQFVGVINLQDNEKCIWSNDYTKNTCRNVVTLNEILNGAATETESWQDYSESTKTFNSAKLREGCLREALNMDDKTVTAPEDSLRNWKKVVKTEE